jgi:hypothetical protein
MERVQRDLQQKGESRDTQFYSKTSMGKDLQQKGLSHDIQFYSKTSVGRDKTQLYSSNRHHSNHASHSSPEVVV